MIEDLTVNNFNEKVVNSNLPVLVEFWAPWCINCNSVKSIVEEIQDTYIDEIIIYKVNVDEEKELAEYYRVRGVPTFMYFVDGHLKERITGISGRNDIIRMFI